MEDYGIPALAIIVYLALIIFIIITWWKIFEKAGQPGWAAIVPIYNYYIMLKITGKPSWWLAVFIGLLIPFVNFLAIIAVFIMSIMIYLELAKRFGKDTGFAIGLILLGIVFLPILAFGDAVYQGGETNEIDEIGTAEE